MSELAMNQNTMYDKVDEVKNLNKVEGFDPRRYMRTISSDGQVPKYYLDVAYRKLWFRLKHPEGKIAKKIIKLTDQLAIVEAKVYLNRNDSEENFISNALAQKYQTADDQFGNKFVELAETAAVGRALADAGFGLQFADMEGEMDPQIADAPIEQMDSTTMPAGTYMEEDGELVSNMESEQEIQDDNIPGQQSIEEFIEIPGAQAPPTMNTPAMNAVGKKTEGTPAAVQNTAGSAISTSQNVQSISDIKKEMPMEQIYSMLTRESAAAVVISAGYHKGKTLGQLAIEKPGALEWYVSSYGGPDNLLRAAAKFLMDAALKQAG